MKQSIALIVIVIAALLTAPSWVSQNKKPIAAHLTKVVKNVKYRASPTVGWSQASAMTELNPGCEVRIQEGSFALIKFMDESQFILRAKTCVRITGEVSDDKFENLGLFMEYGEIAFAMNTRDTGQLRIGSPISVALVQRAEGAITYDAVAGQASITIARGSAEFSSTLTGCKVMVQSGHPGVIDSAGCRNEMPTHGSVKNRP